MLVISLSSFPGPFQQEISCQKTGRASWSASSDLLNTIALVLKKFDNPVVANQVRGAHHHKARFIAFQIPFQAGGHGHVAVIDHSLVQRLWSSRLFMHL